MAKILVVDDAMFMRTRLRSLLEGAGHQIAEASNGREAVDTYAAEHPDLVLMDVTMPEMDGLEALRAIREGSAEAKIIMCSALGQQSIVLEAIKSGARDFIVKPFKPEKVLETVAKHVG
jgi:two-component system, chemotaxis family, chemotaxis protein CheY